MKVLNEVRAEDDLYFKGPYIIDKIRSEYGIEKLDYKIGLNDLEQGSHYDFGLR